MIIKKQESSLQCAVFNESDYLLGCVKHWVECAKRAIKKKGRFIVALSGGKTPQSLYQALSSPEWRDEVEWRHVWLLWSDERAAPPESPLSNYHMAMEAGLGMLDIPKQQIMRMEAESDLGLHAIQYAKQMEQCIQNGKMDLVMLGMGDDGHVASLFPETAALLEKKRLVVANEVPQLKSWRMTMTYPAFERSELVVVYVKGLSKAETLRAVWEGEENPLTLPAQRISTLQVPTLWICDRFVVSTLSRVVG